MSAQYPGQMTGQAACGQKALGSQGLVNRQTKVIEALGGHLVILRDRVQMTISRCESLSNRLFGALDEVREPSIPDSASAPEICATIPSVQKLISELEQQLNVLNKSIDKLETLA